MKINHLPYSSVPNISKKDLAYINLEEGLSDYYKYTPNVDEFKKVIADKSQDKIDRSLLVNELKRQYSSYKLSPAQISNIESLTNDQAFTITTAHQPCLFTGQPSLVTHKLFKLSCKLLV